jgi:adenylate kinase family enzyme
MTAREAKRVCVVGSSGAGKSTFAARCAALGYAHLELDSVMHQAGWVQLDDETARARVDAFTSEHARWIVDGNYARFRDLLWMRADSIVWLDLARSAVVASTLRRSISRLVRREVLWNGNREEWRKIFSLDPDRSVVTWAWTQFASYRDEFEREMRGRRWPHLRWLRIHSRRDANAYLARARERGHLFV